MKPVKWVHTVNHDASFKCPPLTVGHSTGRLIHISILIDLSNFLCHLPQRDARKRIRQANFLELIIISVAKITIANCACE